MTCIIQFRNKKFFARKFFFCFFCTLSQFGLLYRKVGFHLLGHNCDKIQQNYSGTQAIVRAVFVKNKAPWMILFNVSQISGTALLDLPMEITVYNDL